MSSEMLLLILVLAAGFYMAWAIGANDVANAMGTSVGSGALTLRRAVVLAAILEFSGAFFFGSHVSETVQKKIVSLELFAASPDTLVYGMFAALLSAGVWLQVASYFGLPVSTTHSIVGSLVGFGAIVGGMEAVQWVQVGYIVSSWVLSPLAGGLLAYFLFSFLRKQIFYTYNPVGAAKKITPFLVFIVVFTLSLMLLVDGIKQADTGTSFEQELIFCGVLGLAGSLISYLLVRKIPSDSTYQATESPYGSEISYSLGKARRHLANVQAAAAGELSGHAMELIEEIGEMEDSLKKDKEKSISHSEYASVETIFGYLQILSASLMAFAHGANDVANAIGPLTVAVEVLMTGAVSMQAHTPSWALTLGGVGIIVGLAMWGWRVIETIGKKITELTPTRGFAAEFGAAATILIATRLGMPVSTTHTLVGAVIGVGLARGIGALNLGMTRDIVVSWIVTVPAGAILAVGFFYVIEAAFS